MKILIISTYDTNGGAHKAAHRLHKALLEEGQQSIMLVQRKFTSDSTVLSKSGKFMQFISKARYHIDQLPVIYYTKRTTTLFSPSWIPSSFIIKKINEIKPDIIHFHWICDGMIRINDLEKFNKPLVFSLHDMWLFTGGCHYNEDCLGYQNNCSKCKVLNDSNNCYLSKLTFRRKVKTFSSISGMTIIGLSKWIAKLGQNSTLLKQRSIKNLPNLVNTDNFYPVKKINARTDLNLPKDKKLILCGATTFNNNPRKGLSDIIRALSIIDNDVIELIFFGNYNQDLIKSIGKRIHFLGYVSDENEQKLIYSAVDLTLVPSHQENLSLVIMESLACGTPVVAFDIGGNSDMIEHKKNGFLAKPFSIEELKDGIEWILNNREYERISQNARQKVLDEFDSKIVVNKYIELYKETIKNFNCASTLG
jgi:glycosyltransferase involved in cell wall biosynthesis